MCEHKYKLLEQIELRSCVFPEVANRISSFLPGTKKIKVGLNGSSAPLRSVSPS